MSISDTGLQWLHPHVASTVTSEILYTNGDRSDVSFFYAIASERGLDNKVQVMSSGAEFLKEYGDPNIRKYGQAGHNIVNLLGAGANVYVLRVLPDDATYAHAFLNVQTKVNVNEKVVRGSNNNLVKKDDVFLRTCTAYTELSATSKTSLENQLNIRRTSKTIDGYSDNLLLCIYPKGRGEAYNNLGFRININNSYDDMYEFRVYTLEIIQYDEYGNASSLEGPYYVSFYPDAMSFTGDSMFIEDVVNTYSNYVKCIFNKDVYYRLANLINPNVHPQIIDILTGISRSIGGDSETYYDDATLKYEDVHLAIIKYDINGDPIKDNGIYKLNISEANDKNELTTIEIDNSLRQAVYESSQAMLEKMKIALGEILQKRYASQLGILIKVGVVKGEDIIEGETGDTGAQDAILYGITGGKYKEKEDIVDNALHAAIKTLFTDGILPSQLVAGETSSYAPGVYLRDENTKLFKEAGTADLFNYDQSLSLFIEDLMDVLEQIIPYIKVMEKSAGSLVVSASLTDYLETWRGILSSAESFVYTLTNISADLLKLKERLIYCEAIADANEKLSEVAAVFSEFTSNHLPQIAIGVKSIEPDFNHYVTEVKENRSKKLFTKVGEYGKNYTGALIVGACVEGTIKVPTEGNPEVTEDKTVHFLVDTKGNFVLDKDGNKIIVEPEGVIAIDSETLLNSNLGYDVVVDKIGHDGQPEKDDKGNIIKETIRKTDLEVGDIIVPGMYIKTPNKKGNNIVTECRLVVENIPDEYNEVTEGLKLITIHDAMIQGKGFQVGDYVIKLDYDVDIKAVYPFDDALAEIDHEIEHESVIINGEESIGISNALNKLGLTYLTDQYIIEQLNGYTDELGREHTGIIDRLLDVFDKSINLIEPVSALYAFSKHYNIVSKYALLSAFGAGCRSTMVKGVYKCNKAYMNKYHVNESATKGSREKLLDNANDAITEATAALENLKTYIITNTLEGAGTIYGLGKGSDGCISYNNSLITATQRQANIDSLLVKAYKGLIDEDITNKRLMQFKYLLDANYSVSVKTAMVNLAQDIRKDLFVWLDTEICANPTQAINWRTNKFPITTNVAAIYAQDGIIFDEYQGKDVRVTMSYLLSSMIPTHAITTGLQFPMAGNARGAVSLAGLSYIPNELQKEEMYNKQINYVETNGKFNKFGSQLTTTTKNDNLVNINNVLVVLDIKRNVEVMAEDVIFEFNETETINSFQQSLNSYLARYVNNKSVESISAQVYSSDYDKLQKILRVAISVKFYGIIERVLININVLK